MYEEDNLSDAEVGQKLINYLLQTGQIKEKSPNPPIQNPALAQRCEHINNDRYDELIAAFNVILEEILIQGNSKSLSKDSVKESLAASNIPNDQESGAIEQSDNKDQTEKCTKSTDPMSRCLTRFEKELLQKVKTLTNLLNAAMKKRNNNAELNDNLYESSHQPPRDRRQTYSNENNLTNIENVSSENTSLIKKRQAGQSEVGKSDLDHDNQPKNGPSNNNADGDDTTVKEHILSKENNYGVIVQKFIEYIEDKLDIHEDKADHSTSSDKAQSSTDKNQNSATTYTPPASSIFVENGMRIPLRLVRKPDRKFYLVLDRPSLCRGCRN